MHPSYSGIAPTGDSLCWRDRCALTVRRESRIVDVDPQRLKLRRQPGRSISFCAASRWGHGLQCRKASGSACGQRVSEVISPCGRTSPLGQNEAVQVTAKIAERDLGGRAAADTHALQTGEAFGGVDEDREIDPAAGPHDLNAVRRPTIRPVNHVTTLPSLAEDHTWPQVSINPCDRRSSPATTEGFSRRYSPEVYSNSSFPTYWCVAGSARRPRLA